MTKHFHVCIYKVIILALKDFVLCSKHLHEISARVLLVNHFDELGDVLVELVLLGVLVVNGLKSVIIKSISTKHLDNLEFTLHLLDNVFLEVDLHRLLTKLLQNVVEHHVLHVVVCRDLQSHDLPISEQSVLFLCNALLERNQGTAFILMRICQVNQERVKLADGNESSALLVVVSPESLEVFNGLLLDGDICLVGLTEEGIDNDSDEQIEEDLRDDDLEQQVEVHSEGVTTALGTVCVCRVVTAFNNRVIVFALNALVKD